MLQAGTYLGKPSAGATIWESDGGALMVTFAFAILNQGFEGQTIVAHQCLVQKDGTVSERTMRTLKECFPGFDGTDPFWLENVQNIGQYECDLVVEIETYNEKPVAKVQYINPPGRVGGMPQSADRSKVLAKYGAKFRALAGGAPVKPAAKAPPPPAKAPQLPMPGLPPEQAKAAPVEKLPTSTMEECWQVCCEENAGKPDKEIESLWFAAIGKLFPGKSNSDLSPEDWGKVKEHFANPMPA